MFEGGLRNLWKAHRARLQIAGFVGAIALAIAVPFIQAPLCSISEPSGVTIAYEVSIDRESHKQNGGEARLPAVSQFTFGPTIDGGIEKEDRTKATYYAPQQKEDWAQRYWCDVDVSDYFLVLFTLALAISTFYLWRETERLAQGAKDQSEKMARSIAEAARAADAMGRIAEGVNRTAINSENATETLREVTAKQMRAYLTIAGGDIFTQHPLSDFHFELNCLVTNTGHTPAHDVKVAFNLIIIRIDDLAGYDLSLLEPPGEGGTINAGQTFTSSAIAPVLYDENTVWESIWVRGGRWMLVYGTVWYTDVFKARQHTNFCQVIRWKDAGNRVLTNLARHNDST